MVPRYFVVHTYISEMKLSEISVIWWQYRLLLVCQFAYGSHIIFINMKRLPTNYSKYPLFCSELNYLCNNGLFVSIYNCKVKPGLQWGHMHKQEINKA